MNGFLLDTNVPSELTRPQPQASVTEWLEQAADEQLYLSVVTLGEIVKGIAALPESNRRAVLQNWLDDTLKPWFRGRILPVNEPVAERWGILAAQCRARGTPLTVADGFIAATAMVHDLTIVTRNVADFEGLGVSILNPWQ